jgi:hypothetical protein
MDGLLDEMEDWLSIDVAPLLEAGIPLSQNTDSVVKNDPATQDRTVEEQASKDKEGPHFEACLLIHFCVLKSANNK